MVQPLLPVTPPGSIIFLVPERIRPPLTREAEWGVSSSSLAVQAVPCWSSEELAKELRCEGGVHLYQLR